jgi:hypothetical protein
VRLPQPVPPSTSPAGSRPPRSGTYAERSQRTDGLASSPLDDVPQAGPIMVQLPTSAARTERVLEGPICAITSLTLAPVVAGRRERRA